MTIGRSTAPDKPRSRGHTRVIRDPYVSLSFEATMMRRTLTSRMIGLLAGAALLAPISGRVADGTAAFGSGCEIVE